MSIRLSEGFNKYSKYSQVENLNEILEKAFQEKYNKVKNFLENSYKIYEEKRYVTACYAGNLSGVMYPEGDVYPCEILSEEHKIGNIRDFNLDFKKLWLSHKARKEVKFIRNTKCYCTHECFNIVNILFNPKFYPKILKTSKLI